MFVKTETTIEQKLKLGVAAIICSMITIMSAVAMVVNQTNFA
ncbi:hypothetical protein [Aurantiacibacter gilvus]|uniref:Uncharacterized protein n=1 Tax=Aurantiacibacter gilvus TaxID=3139141 RepID=A0ABU9IG42_9SPHN